MQLNPSKILYKYLSKRFFLAFVIVFVCLFLITFLLEGMEIARKAAYNHTSFNLSLFELGAFKTLSTISSFFPFVVFISCILFFVLANNKLELTAIRGFGISVWQLSKCLGLTTIIIGVFYCAIFDTISALSVEKVREIERLVFHKNRFDPNITVTNNGLWFKDLQDENYYIIHARSFNENSEALLNIRFFKFKEKSDLQCSIYGKKGIIKDGKWVLDNAKVVDVSGEVTFHQTLEIPTQLSLNSVNKMTTDPKTISLWSIPKYIDMLEKVGLSTLRYRMQQYVQCSSILQMLMLMMLATMFCVSYDHRNVKSYVINVVFVMFVAFPLHFFNNVLIAFGTSGKIPIFYSTFLFPSISLLALTLAVYKR